MRAALALLALAGCVDPSLSSREQSIINGERSLGDSAVVMLVGYPPSRSVIHACTAVMIAPTVALTAAHCVDEPNHPNYLYGIFEGDDAGDMMLVDYEDDLVPVASTHPHPAYSEDFPFYADLAVVQTTQPLSLTLPIRRTPLTPAIVGAPATIVGYGQTSPGVFNQTRYEAQTTVVALETSAGLDDTIVVGDGVRRACQGDSGGPAIVNGEVVGIDSYGPTGCGSAAHYRRVDSHLSFIDQYAPPLTPDPEPEEPDLPDPDDQVDDGGCSTTGGSPGGLLVLLALLASRRRGRGLRRHRRAPMISGA